MYGVSLAHAALSVTSDGNLYIDDEGYMTPASGSRTELFTVTNVGGVPTTAIAIALTQSTSKFSIVGGAADACISGTTILDPGSSCTVTVRFAPSGSVGTFTASLSATPAVGPSSILGVSASSGNDAIISVDPGLGAFGDVAVGDSRSFVYTVSNVGSYYSGNIAFENKNSNFLLNDADAVQSSALAGVIPADLKICVSGETNLKPGGSLLDYNGYRTDACYLVATYRPLTAAPSPASESNIVTVSSAEPGVGSFPMIQAGRGIDALDIAYTNDTAPFATNTTDAYTFPGDVAPATSYAIDQRSVPKTFVVHNVSGVNTGIIHASTSGDYVIASDDCSGLVLSGGATCTVEVAFAPQAVGVRNGTLSVTGAPGGADSATLVGTGR